MQINQVFKQKQKLEHLYWFLFHLV